jgi:glycine/serine hydroxymethyltransferase
LQDLDGYLRNATFPGHTSSSHSGTLAALYLDIAELNAFRHEYPARLIENAKAFAAAAERLGLQVEGPRSRGFTDTHIALLNWGYARGNHYSRELQRNNILTNAQALAGDSGFTSASGTRVGMTYMTKAGAGPHHMSDIAQLFKDVRDRKKVLEEVRRYRRENGLLGVHYSLPAEKAESLAREVVEVLMRSYKHR